jgi:REP element-mobilizing transposase RayT
MDFSEAKIFHAYNRGVDRRPIFANYGNYIFLLQRMRQYLPSYQVSILAYCLMPNHYHLLALEETEGHLYRFIQRVFNSYSQAFNRQQNRSGSLFQGRVKIKEVVDHSHIIYVARYIHLNPVQAGLSKTPIEWKFSDYSEWLECKPVFFPRSQKFRRELILPEEYRQFIGMAITEEAVEITNKYV